MTTLEQALQAYPLRGTPVYTGRYGCGHINDTYAIACDSGCMYILQRVNSKIFTRPWELMENVAAVTQFLSQKTQDPRGCLRLIPTKEGKSYFVDSEGEHWRLFPFIDNSICLQKAESAEDFKQSAIAFGRFQKLLAQFPAAQLHEPIPNFHNTVDRYRQFHEALAADVMDRARLCEAEIRFYLDREAEAGCIVERLADGRLPLRVTHNDTKLNNVMLDYDSRQALCVIDLDTIMPGSSLYDFGDSIRFGAATAAEDEQDLSKVSMSLELFRTFTEGFLSACGDSLTETEVQMLPVGAKMMTLECGLRFLTDYLKGDTYFKTSRPGQNLDRARTQLTLVADMEAKMPEMLKIIQEVQG
ncbi:MAG: aminoglycoside phosphotransferase family protein [Oscillospiraceae bacterium]|nr:aminoglycoside phosphotransferase family protein [Oscillospiraceae bacterium]